MSGDSATWKTGRDSRSKSRKGSTFKRLSSFGHNLGHRVSSKESNTLRSNSALPGNIAENDNKSAPDLRIAEDKDGRTLEADMRNFTFGNDSTKESLPRVPSGGLSPYATTPHVISDTNTNVSGGSATLAGEERRPSAISTGSDESSHSVGHTLVRKMAALKDIASSRASMAPGATGTASRQPTLTRQQSIEAPHSEVVPFLYQDFNEYKELGEAPIHSSLIDGRTTAMASNGGVYASTQDDELRRLASAYHSRMTRNFTEHEKDKKKTVFGRFRRKVSNEDLAKHSSTDRPSPIYLQDGNSAFRQGSKSDLSSLDSSLFSYDTLQHPVSRKTSRFSNGRVSAQGSLHGSFGRYRHNEGELSSNRSYHLDTNLNEMGDVVTAPKTSRTPISSLTPWEETHSLDDKQSETGWVAPDSWVVRRPDQDITPRLMDMTDDEDLSPSVLDPEKGKITANVGGSSIVLLTFRRDISLEFIEETIRSQLCLVHCILR